MRTRNGCGAIVKLTEWVVTIPIQIPKDARNSSPRPIAIPSFLPNLYTSMALRWQPVLEAGNAIGGGDWTAYQLIPDLMRAFMAGQPCLIRNPLSYRPWQFVLEPLRGYLLIAERLAENGAAFASGWNFGPLEGDAKPVSWIADTLRSKWGKGASWVQDSTVSAKEARALKLDASRAATCLDWHPVLRIEQTLSWIVEWYQAYESGGDLRTTTIEQIQRYERLLSEFGLKQQFSRNPLLIRAKIGSLSAKNSSNGFIR